MNWRILVALSILAGLMLGFSPAFSQGSSTGTANVFVDHYYSLEPLGFGVLNDSITFSNNGTSSVQIPTLQVGLPGEIAARTSSFSLAPSGKFTLSQSKSNGNTTVTITPNQPTLSAGANLTVALKGVVTDVLNITSKGFNGTAPLLVLYSPSLNVNVTAIKSNIIAPSNVDFKSVETGFAYSPVNGSIMMTQKAVRPVASEGYLVINATQEGQLTPIAVTQLTRAIVPAANGSPMVEDKFTIHNLSTFNLTQIHLDILHPGLEEVTELPSTSVPLINSKGISLSAGELPIAAGNIGSPLFPKSNLSLTFSYPLPSSLTAVSGNSVTVTVPYTPVIGAPVGNYSIILAPTQGIVPSGPTKVLDKSVNPLTPGDVQFTYTITAGWATNQAVPAGILVFALGFVMFAVQRPTTEKEGEKAVRKTSDVLRAFEEKTGLETQYMGEFASAPKGSITKADFDRMRNEVSELRSRAIQRLNEMKQVLGSGRQYDALTRVAEAEKEEDRAFRDLLNLYMQYHGNRMNEETFKRLQPNYKRRVDSAINHLSDTLHETQTEEK